MPGITAKTTTTCVLFLAAGVLFSTLLRAADKPPNTQPEPQWGDPVKPYLAGEGKILLAPTGYPLCLIGDQVVEFKTARKTGVVLADLPKDITQFAFSPDGAYFAAITKPGNLKEVSVFQVWDLKTGQSSPPVSGAPKAPFEYLAFSNSQYVVTCARPDNNATIYSFWDPKTSTKIKNISTSQTTGSATAISPTGRYLAKLASDSVTVYDIQTGTAVARMSPPPNITRRNPFSQFRYLTFSPDSKELAAYSDSFSDKRLCVWNTAGKLVEDISLSSSWENSLSSAGIQWFPDGQAWLIGQRRIIDRASKKDIIHLDYPFAARPQTVFLDNEHLLVIPDRDADSSVTFEIPWSQARESLKAMGNPDVPAVLRPGMKVSIEYEFDLFMGHTDSAVSVLAPAAARMLGNHELSVADNQSVTLFIKLTTKPKPPDPPPSRPGMMDARAFNNQLHDRLWGPAGPIYLGLGEVVLVSRQLSKPIYRRDIYAETSPTREGDLSDAAMHLGMLQNAASSVIGAEFPYFIPLDKSISALPITVAVPNK